MTEKKTEVTAKWQLGKRYRLKENSGSTWLVEYIFKNGNVAATARNAKGEEWSAILNCAHYGQMEIVPPEPRTGKAYLVRCKQTGEITNILFNSPDWAKNPRNNFETIPIEWKEVV